MTGRVSVDRMDASGIPRRNLGLDTLGNYLLQTTDRFGEISKIDKFAEHSVLLIESSLKNSICFLV